MSGSYNLQAHDNPAFITDGSPPDEKKKEKTAVKDSKKTNGTRVTIAEEAAEEQEAEEDRATWGNSLEFLMSCIAMNVGLGNIWRFPFVAYENGGGAFLIPYIAVLMLLGRPMYYLEMCLGQFSSRGNVKMFESIAPVLKGVGFGQLIGTFSVATYYCSLMAITLFYLMHSFTPNLPWAKCNPEWETNPWVGNRTCLASGDIERPDEQTSISSAELWFRIEALKEQVSIDDGIGYPDWQLTLCLFMSWVVTFVICAKGVQSSGKASYFLAIFPFVILFALLIRSATLPGADTGILYFVNPDWEKLLSAKVWYNAVTQCFFSLNIGFGSVTMYASYNNFRHNVYRDAMVVTTLDTFTSFLAGLIIFGILGNLAQKMGVEVGDVVKSGGTGLAFISYPEAIAKFEDVPWLFAILFFVMLFVLGVGSLVALQGCAFTVIMDAFPHLKIWHVSGGAAILGFIIGLVYITPGGQFIFTMVDFFGGTFIFYVLTIVELLSVMWWYGLDNICLDIEFMLKRKPGIYWRVCWAVIIPIVLLFVFIYFIATLEELTYENKAYPAIVICWGWALFGVGIAQPVIWWLIQLYQKRNSKTLSKNVKDTFKHDNWGPQNEIAFKKWQEFKRTKREEKAKLNRHWLVNKLCILIGK